MLVKGLQESYVLACDMFRKSLAASAWSIPEITGAKLLFYALEAGAKADKLNQMANILQLTLLNSF